MLIEWLLFNVSWMSVLIGIVSKGNECGHPDYPGIYTRVTKILKWIESIAVASLDSNCKTPRPGQDFPEIYYLLFHHYSNISFTNNVFHFQRLVLAVDLV